MLTRRTGPRAERVTQRPGTASRRRSRIDGSFCFVVTYDAATALIVVDVQNDFADPAGNLPVAGGADVVPFINDHVARAGDGGAFVAYSQDWHPAHTPHFAQDGGVWPVHCVQDTWGAELHPELTVAGPVVRKGANGEDGYSAFSMRDPLTGETVPTELAALLADRGAERVVVAGLATDYCVRSTVLDALELGYPTTVLAAGIRAVDVQPGDGRRALEELAVAGAHIDDSPA